MQAAREPVEAAGDDKEVIDLPNQYAEDQDRRWGFAVGDVVQLVQGRSQKRTYALYCGHDRVIHAWTPSRQNFRIRVDPLRSLQRSGYKATVSSTDFDALFLQLLDLSPFAPAEVIRRAKTALHATTASCTSNLSFILFARYGDSIFVLSQSLKTAYSIALRKWMFGSAHVFTGERPESPQSRGWSLDDPVIKHWRCDEGDANAASTDPEPMSAIESFLGTYGEHLISEWLGRSLGGASSRKSPWFAIPMPAATNCLSTSLSAGSASTSFVANNRSNMPYAAPLFMLYDKPSAEFRVRFPVAGGLSERMAGDRMECGVCWLDFTQLKVIVLKCSHYMCDPCLRLLSRRECPYCRAPIRLVCEVSECVKQEACRLMMEAMALEDKAPAPDPQENESAHDHTENPSDSGEEPEKDS